MVMRCLPRGDEPPCGSSLHTERRSPSRETHSSSALVTPWSPRWLHSTPVTNYIFRGLAPPDDAVTLLSSSIRRHFPLAVRHYSSATFLRS